MAHAASDYRHPSLRTASTALVLLLPSVALAENHLAGTVRTYSIGPPAYSLLFPNMVCRVAAAPGGRPSPLPPSRDGYGAYCTTGTGFNLPLRFSLADRGNWVIRCQGYTNPYWACDVSPQHTPCGIECATVYGTQAITRDFSINVYNNRAVGRIGFTGTPAYNSTLTLGSNPSDAIRDPDHPDGTGLRYGWWIHSRPRSTATGSLSSTSIANPRLTFHNDQDIGTWVIGLSVTDLEGETTTYAPLTIVVPNRSPRLTISGPTRVLVRQDIRLTASATDDDGGDVTIDWDVLRPGGTWQNSIARGTSIALSTTVSQRGTWVFRVRARDNDAAPNSETPVEWRVEVANLPPRIVLNKPAVESISVGTPITVGTTVFTDDDGGGLTFQWEVLQSPQAGPIRVGSLHWPYADINIATTAAHAGTYVFRLRATDDEGEPTDSDPYTVLVDAVPEARITGPETIQLHQFPLVLDGASSVDPDSPCNDNPARCHDVVTGRTPDVSAGIVTYRWFLLEVSANRARNYRAGPVEDALHVVGDRPALYLRDTDILTGRYVFGLEVTDAEGHTSFTDHKIQIDMPRLAPSPRITQSGYFRANRARVLLQDVRVSGEDSVDPDNWWLTRSYGTDRGIRQYWWNVIPPIGCAAPSLPSGPTLRLYSAGETIQRECIGRWTIRLTVADDDVPAEAASTDTSLSIGNCGGPVMVDRPTTMFPLLVESVDRTDVTIDYCIDTSTFEDPIFALGMRAELSIIPNGEYTPVYQNWDTIPLFGSVGSDLQFRWFGLTNSGAPVRPGLYDLRIRLVDASGAETYYSTTEAGAIHMEQVYVRFANSSDRFVPRDAVEGGRPLRFEYTVEGTSTIDSVIWRVRNPNGEVLHEDTLRGGLSGVIIWDGRDGGTTVPPGNYSLEVIPQRSGIMLGTGARYTFTIYRIEFTASLGSVRGPEVPVLVNGDDDNHNSMSDLFEVAAGENDLVPFTFRIEPPLNGAVTFSNGGGGGTFRLWRAANKSGPEMVLPYSNLMVAMTGATPFTNYIEGASAGRAHLEAQFVADATPLAVQSISLDIVNVEIVRGTPTSGGADYVNISLWENAFDSNDAIRNGMGVDDFIEQDPEHFYVRVTDAAANHDDSSIDSVMLQFGVLADVGSASPVDPMQPLVLLETTPTSGVFLSASQLLTSNDDDGTGLFTHSDDTFDATDGAGFPAPDESLNDRTHHATIDSALVTFYDAAGGPIGTLVPVCARAPDARRRVLMHTRIFDEPFNDEGYYDAHGVLIGAHNGVFDYVGRLDASGRPTGVPHRRRVKSEPYGDLSSNVPFAPVLFRPGEDPLVRDGWGPVVSEESVQQEMRKSTAAWAPSCTMVEQFGAIEHGPAPRDRWGIDVLANGMIEFGTAALFNEYDLLTRMYVSTFQPNIFEAFYAAPLNSQMSATTFSAYAATDGPGFGTTADEWTAAILGQINPDRRTLAHELGHAMTNRDDENNGPHQFFPASHTGTDTDVATYRRFPRNTLRQVTTVRPTGNTNGEGSQLRNPR